MVIISKEDYEKIVAHAVSEPPNEACGFIAGKTAGTDRIIEKVYLLTNINKSNEHYSLACGKTASYLILPLMEREKSRA